MEGFTVAVICWVLGGFVNGISGFGFALIAMPIFTQYVDLVYAVPTCSLLSLTINLQLGWTYRRNADWHRLRPMIIGALPGAIIGATILSRIPEPQIKVGMGLFLLSYSLWGLFFERVKPPAVSSRWGYVAGLCSSAIGTAFGMGGPPSIVYTSLAGWSKDAIKAGISSFFLCAGLMMVTVQLVYGLHSTTSLYYFAISAPALAVGCRLGVIFSRRIGERAYHNFLFGLLALMAAMMLYRAVPLL